MRPLTDTFTFSFFSAVVNLVRREPPVCIHWQKTLFLLTNVSCCRWVSSGGLTWLLSTWTSWKEVGEGSSSTQHPWQVKTDWNALTKEKKKSSNCGCCQSLLSPSHRLIWHMWNNWTDFLCLYNKTFVIKSHSLLSCVLTWSQNVFRQYLILEYS